MIYFLSDTHLGLKFAKTSARERELQLCGFLDSIMDNCDELFLVGDIFDFWFEWNKTVPQGFVRVLGKLAQMTDRGIKVHFIIGNHDLWLGKYLQEEVGLTIHTKEFVTTLQGKKLFITHGDTLYNYKGFSKFLSVTFRSRRVKWLFQRIIHPDLMVRFGRNWSESNRKKHNAQAHTFTAEDDNWVVQSRKILAANPDINYFVYGHLHFALDYELTDSCRMIVLGEWVDNPHYAVLDNGVLELKSLNK